jgi:hypothetical protein
LDLLSYIGLCWALWDCWALLGLLGSVVARCLQSLAVVALLGSPGLSLALLGLLVAVDLCWTLLSSVGLSLVLLGILGSVGLCWFLLGLLISAMLCRVC